MNAISVGGEKARGLIAFTLLLFVGVAFYQLRANSHLTAVPGDLIDARFNSVILEHVYQWLRGDVKSLWSPGFFYPVKDVLALSDNHFGSILPYALLRFLGFEREPALALWLMLGGILNYVLAYVAFRRLKLRHSGAAAAAFVFAFSLPVLAQQAHAQFAFRMFVPLVFVNFYAWLESGRTSSLAWTAVWLMAQFYCAIYTGVFTVYLLIAMFVGWLLLGKAGAIRRSVMQSFSRTNLFGTLASAFVVLACGAAVFALLAKYKQVTLAHGFERPRDEILGMLPRVWSYLISDFSKLSHVVGGSITDISMRHEHQLFIGVGVLLFCLVGALVALRRIEYTDIGRLAFVSVLLLVVGTLNVSNVSFYRLFLHVPGIDSIRAVTRVMLVMVVPLGILSGIGFQRVLTLLERRGALRLCVGGLLAVVLLVAESSTFEAGNASFAAWRARQANFESRVPAGAVPGSVIMADRSSDSPYLDDLDAMIYAQDHGMASINGYSGYVPPGAGMAGSCESAESFVRTQIQFGRLGANQAQQLLDRIVMVPKQQCIGGRVARFSGRIPAEVARNVSIAISSVVYEEGGARVTVSIHNGSSQDISTLEMGGRNVRLSWRVVEPGDDKAPPGWDSRQDLMLQLSPGESASVEFHASGLNRGPGTLQANLVQETVFWFSEEGMAVASTPLNR